MIPAPTRRDFIARSTQAVAAAACGGLLWNAFLVKSAKAAPFALRPPGAQPDFLATCIKCGLCVEACPFDTLQLARAGDSPPLGTPYFTPRDVPCYMCPDVPCAKVCPTGALDRGLDGIAHARMGLAVVDPEHCLSWQGLRCEVCYRVCPVQGKAITVANHPRRISKHAMFVPVVHSDACTGCGVCEKACPTEVAAVRIVDPKLVQGRTGAHYRMDWKPEEASAAVPEGTKPTVPPRDSALDYLNRGGTP